MKVSKAFIASGSGPGVVSRFVDTKERRHIAAYLQAEWKVSGAKK